MADRPIIFSAPMVLALLDGRKTQTRRVLKPQPEPFDAMFSDAGKWWTGDAETGEVHQRLRVPFAVGDRLWLREAWADLYGFAEYRAGHEEARAKGPRVDVRWRPSIHMPRWASRLTLTVTDVRVQRLQEISEADAIAEGATTPAVCEALDLCGGHDAGMCACQCVSPSDLFSGLWESIHGAGAWAANPWVAAITFTVEQRNIDR